MKESRKQQWPGESFGNWGRWPNDRGTLNLITSEVILNAVQLVRKGKAIACSHSLTAKDLHRGTPAFRHEMIYCGEAPAVADENVQGAGDEIFIRIHGLTNTHIDAVCHTGHNGLGFNGHPYTEMVTRQEGGQYAAISETGAIVTRGVIADIPRHRGIAYLEPGEPVGVQELREATPELKTGDALLIRTGRWVAPAAVMDDRSVDPHGRYSGLHPDCMWYIAERDIAVLGTDGPGDNFPSPIDECHVSIHVLAETYLGLPLIHSMDMEALADECAKEGRNTFLFCLAPLNIAGGTGSPVTPIAVL